MSTTELVAEICILDPGTAAAGLQALGADARGFLDLDPVTQNEALLRLELVRTGGQVFRSGNTLLGYRPNPEQPGQACVATTSADTAALRAFVSYLALYRRSTSFMALAEAGSTPAAAFGGCGFGQVGTMRQHRYHSGRYHDVTVYAATWEDLCPS